MVDPISSGFDMTRELLNVLGKILDKLPSYSQSKKEKYFDLLQRFQREMSRDYESRDDNLVSIYKMELEDFIKIFSDEIDTKLNGDWGELK